MLSKYTTVLLSQCGQRENERQIKEDGLIEQEEEKDFLRRKIGVLDHGKVPGVNCMAF